MKEQRVANRFDCDQLVYYRADNAAGVGVVTEVSFSGLRMSCPAGLSTGEVIDLLSVHDEALGQRSLRGRVCWCLNPDEKGKTEVGIQLLDSLQRLSRSFLGQLLASLEGRPSRLFQRRESVRATTNHPVRVGVGFSFQVEGVLEDLSTGGALLASNQSWAPNSRLMLWAFFRNRPLVLSVRVVRKLEDGRTALRFENLSEWQERVVEDLVRESVSACPVG